MSITADLIRGHTDAIILAHLLERDSYGYEINKSILDQTDHRYELMTVLCYYLRDQGFSVKALRETDGNS